jgi:hypothetical protein
MSKGPEILKVYLAFMIVKRNCPISTYKAVSENFDYLKVLKTTLQ